MANEVVSRADELLKLKELLDQGVLTQEEFDAQKQQILAAPQAQTQQQPQHTASPQQPQQQAAPPIIINNATSSSASVSGWKVRRKYNVLLDILLIFCTCGTWIIWMIFRPKYY